MSSTVQTDLQLVDIIELANLADEIGAEDVETEVLDYDYTVDYVTEYGAAVLLPQFEKIRPTVDRLFAKVEVNGPTQAEIIAAQAIQATQEAEYQAQEQQREEIKTQLSSEGATVIIQNGTEALGMETETARFLQAQGFDIVQFGPAEATNYPSTVIVDYSGKEYTLGTLARFFNVSQENIRSGSNLISDVDIRVIIGADFSLPDVDQPSTSVLQEQSP
jgi:hypothetical protein